MPILITDTSSFIGFHLLEELVKQGLQVRAAYVPGQSLANLNSEVLIEGLNLESFPLDLSDRNAVYQAVKGCSTIFHNQQLFSFAHHDKKQLYQINHLGTKHVMEAALAFGVEKVVYTSDMELLRAPPGQSMATERDGVSLDQLSTHFERSRFLAEREIHRLQGKGLPVVTVHPTVTVGAGGDNTLFGEFLTRFMSGKIRFCLETGLNLIAIQDVVKGHILAIKRGKVGRRYLLGNQNLSLVEILKQLESMTGISAPKHFISFGSARLAQIFRSLIPGTQRIPTPVLKRLKQPLFFDTAYAQKELGLPQSNVWEAIKNQLRL